MTSPDSASVTAKLVEIVSTVIEVPPEAVDDRLSSETAEAWDSVRHLTLILAVEDAFGITFDESQIAELTNFAALRAAVEQRRTSA